MGLGVEEGGGGEGGLVEGVGEVGGAGGRDEREYGE
jgi:hypothetical protein